MNPRIVEGCLPFTSLRLDPKDISLSMGAGYVPDAEIRTMCRALEEEIAGICIPRFLYVPFDSEPAGTCKTGMDGIYLRTGAVITPRLKDTAGYTLSMTTTGREFETFQHETCTRSDILREFLLNAYGSATAETVVRGVCQKVETQMFASGYGVNRPYSPGYCGWRVTRQQLLFGYLPESPCGIRLDDSSLMSPIKPVGSTPAYDPRMIRRKYECELCGKADCCKNRNKLER